MVQAITLSNQCIRFQCNKICVRVHRTGNLLYIIAVTDIFEDFLIVQGYLRSKHIRFVFHSAFLHIEDIELFEAARFHGFLSVQNIVSDLVEHNDAFHHRMQIVFNEDKSVTHQNLIGSTLLLETHMNIDAIAGTLQFESPQYFSKVFKKRTGMTPKYFRNKIFKGSVVQQM